jgi:hypothetical protein
MLFSASVPLSLSDDKNHSFCPSKNSPVHKTKKKLQQKTTKKEKNTVGEECKCDM